MQYTRESHFVDRAIIPYLKKNKIWYFKKEALALRGIPDLILCIDGRFVALEAKRSYRDYRKNDPRTSLQRHILKRLHKAGGYGSFVYPENWEDVRGSLDRMQDGEEPGYYLLEKIS